jgi:hypothetical protein
MKKLALLALLILAAPAGAQNTMSFFITSAGSGDGARLGGLAGADARCKQLADASGVAGVAGKTWHAYLSAKAAGGPASRERERPHRSRPVVQRQGRDGGAERRRPAQREQQAREGEQPDRKRE